MRFVVVSFCLLVMSHGGVVGQELKTKNLIIVTLDGLRWQELFEGADPSVIQEKKYVKDANTAMRFWKDSPGERRKTLMPFLWNVVASRGQLYGNRNFRNKVNCTNHHLISYPGYSEMLVGFHDRRVSSNRKIANPNATVLEFIQRQPEFRNEVAAFATWDAFSFILRENQSGIYVNAGKEPAKGNISMSEKKLNRLQKAASARTDSMTFRYAMEYLNRKRPRVLLIGFDETDQHAHAGRYDGYLRAAQKADFMLAQLWQWIQEQPDYRDQTTLFITTDHGRGMGSRNWRNHRLFAAGSRHIWFALIGPDTPAFGEMTFRSRIYQDQVAKTLAAFLDVPYQSTRKVGEIVQTMLAVPMKNDNENVADISDPERQ